MLRRIMWGMLGCVIVSVTPIASAGDDNQRSEYLRNAVNACSQSGDDKSVCRFFAAKTLKEAFGLDDFCQGSTCMSAYEISEAIKTKTDKWQELGNASDQNVLNQASELASKGKIVLAVQAENSVGQVGIIMPGNKVKSGRWNLDVPLVAAARVDKPQSSLYAQGINYLFTDPSRVAIYSTK